MAQHQGFFYDLPLLTRMEDDLIALTMIDFIMPATKWEEIKHQVDAFYAAHSPAEIELYNRDRQDEWDAPKKSMPGVSSDGPGSVYLIEVAGSGYKIGITGSLKDRLKQIRNGMPMEPVLLHEWSVPLCREIEKELHTMFADKRLRGEWFALDSEDVSKIEQYMASPEVGAKEIYA